MQDHHASDVRWLAVGAQVAKDMDRRRPHFDAAEGRRRAQGQRRIEVDDIGPRPVLVVDLEAGPKARAKAVDVDRVVSRLPHVDCERDGRIGEVEALAGCRKNLGPRRNSGELLDGDRFGGGAVVQRDIGDGERRADRIKAGVGDRRSGGSGGAVGIELDRAVGGIGEAKAGCGKRAVLQDELVAGAAGGGAPPA